MRSSTSSFKRPEVRFTWPTVLGSALIIFLALTATLEAKLRSLGYQPTIQDTRKEWMRERLRASELGKRALILIGASRIQLGIDMDELRESTGLEPVQLAIDASASGPVLRGLADDPSITGTIIVDFYPSGIGPTGRGISGYQDDFDRLQKIGQLASIAPGLEDRLAGALRKSLSLYANGATPWLSLTRRALPQHRQNQYLQTFADRSRAADYSMIEMPRAYHARVLRMLGMDDEVSPERKDIKTFLRQAVDAQTARDPANFRRHTAELALLVKKLQRRQVQVFFVAMPTSGMVREIEQRRFPPALFWDEFRLHIGTRSLSASEDAELSGFVCPDGSHLDMRDRKQFTSRLVKALKLSTSQQAD